MAVIVLNEWVFHDLLGENGTEAQQETASFLDVFFMSADMLALPREDRWLRKTSRLMAQADARLRRIGRQFLTLLGDRNRTIDTRAMGEADIPSDLLACLPEEDVYLVRAYVLASADLLVTTDTALRDSLADSRLVSCIMRDKFLSEYLPR